MTSPSTKSSGPKPDFIICGQVQLKTMIGSGSFGDVYSAVDNRNQKQYAVKIEHTMSRHAQLEKERDTYKAIGHGKGLPQIRWYGQVTIYNALVMDLLGPSLEDVFNFCARQFSLKTVLMLADQMIQRMEFIHTRHYIHRDLKPDNFVMGNAPNHNTVYLIDFGLAKQFRDPVTRIHIAYREGKCLTGTARYTSVNTHMGIEQSRRDDMEAIGYMFIYFLAGSLPWQGLKSCDKQHKYDKIHDKKVCITPSDLCKGFPQEFTTYLQYCQNLCYAQIPDYAYLLELFQKLFRNLNYEYDCNFDWVVLKRKENDEAAKAVAVARANEAARTVNVNIEIQPQPTTLEDSRKATVGTGTRTGGA